MKFLIAFFSCFVFCFHPVVGQNLSNINGYPPLTKSISAPEYNWDEVNSFKTDGLPRKAIDKIKEIQKRAIKENNSKEFWKSCKELDELLERSQYDPIENQLFVWEFAQKADSLPFPLNNLMHYQVYKWINSLYWKGELRFDDESLLWNIEGKQTKLVNQSINELYDYHQKRSLNNPSELMKFSSSIFWEKGNNSQIQKYSITLFECLALKVINSPNNYRINNDFDNRMISDSTFFSFTNNLMKADNVNDPEYLNIQLYYHIEQLCLKNMRWDAYAFWVEQRLNEVVEKSTYEKINDFDREKLLISAYSRFEDFLNEKASSSRFSHHIAQELFNKSKEYNWKTNTSPKDNCIRALKKIEKSLNKFPNSEFIEQLSELKKVILSDDLNFSLKGNFSKGKPSILTAEYRNVYSSALKIYKIESEKQDGYAPNLLKNYQLSLVFSKKLKFNKDSLFLKHDKDFIIPEFSKNGKYLFIIGRSEQEIAALLTVDTLLNRKDFAYQVYQLSSLQVLTKDNKGRAEFIVTNANNGKPVNKASIHLTKRFYRGRQSPDSTFPNDNVIYTNTAGKADFQGNESYEYTVKSGIDSITGYVYSYKQEESREQNNYKVYTDRGIYRPGQKVFIKVIAFYGKNNENKLVTSKKVSIKIKDQNSQIVCENSLQLNEFGSCSGTFSLPKNGYLLGTLSIYVEDSYQKSFRVEEYKRPTFEVTFDEITGKIKLGDSVTLSGNVLAFAGYPIANAKTTIRISQYNYFPHWCDVKYDERTSSIDLDVLTDAKGKFKFTFLPEKSKYLFGSRFSFTATIVDGTGEVQEATKSLYIGKESYSISMSLDENLLSTVDNKVNIIVQNSQNIEQKQAVISYAIMKISPSKWIIDRLNQAEYQDFKVSEFEKKFPSTSYFAASSGQIIDTIATGKIKSNEPVDLNKILVNQVGHFSIEAYTIDEVGEKSIAQQFFNYIQPNKLKEQHQSTFWMVSNAKSPKMGDEIEISIGSSYKRLNVYVEHVNSAGKSVGKWIILKHRVTLKYKITDKEKDGFLVTCITGINGKVYQEAKRINVVNDEKSLEVKLSTSRDDLRPGSKEKWAISVADINGKPVISELLVGMYDASLDQFSSNYWDAQFYYPPYFDSYWNHQQANILQINVARWQNENYYSLGNYENMGDAESGETRYTAPKFFEKESFAPSHSVAEDVKSDSTKQTKNDTLKQLEEPSDSKQGSPRTNFDETAFFYPSIYADTSGQYRFEYILPDALTKWRFMAVAHTTDLQSGSFEKTFVAKKEVMIQPNTPRFFREGDLFVFSSKVVNTTDKNQEMVVRLKFINPITEQDVTSLFGNIVEQKITLLASSSQEVSWNLKIPQGQLSIVAYLIEADGKLFSDAEKKTLPIVSNRMLISESKPFVKTSSGDKTFSFDRIKTISPTAQKISMSLEIQTQPLWTTLITLPYLIEFPYECAEQTFSRYFGNVLAQKIIQDNPAFKRIIDTWKEIDPKAFISELEKNPELKTIILTETPWLLDAQNENMQRQHLSLLFDENNLRSNSNASLAKLKEMKASDGGWSWFGGEKSNAYITQHIVSGFGQLKQLGVKIDEEIIQGPLLFLDALYDEEFKKIKPDVKQRLGGLTEMHVHWLVARSYFNQQNSTSVTYYNQCLLKDWKNFNLHTQALAGMSFVYSGDKVFAEKIKNSIVDRATIRPEMGMYWNENKMGYSWSQSQIETQSKLIEFFSAIGNLDKEVQSMQLWLLQQKRTNSWETTKSTTSACHALLINKKTVQNQGAQEVKVKLGDGTDLGILNPDSGSTFTWTGKDIAEGKAIVTINTTNDHPVFGAIHFQYLEEMSKIQKSQGEIRVERHYYMENNGKEEEINSSTVLALGTKVKVKIAVTANRSMEFVHVKDSKAAGFEARQTISGNHYSTVSYYQVNKDASTDIFIDFLPKGTHVFEYEIFASGRGELSTGAAIVECMYAPIFRANSDGIKLIVK